MSMQTPRFRARKAGQNLSEFGLVLTLVCLASVAGLTLMGDEISKLLGKASNRNAGDKLISLLDPATAPGGGAGPSSGGGTGGTQTGTGTGTTQGQSVPVKVYFDKRSGKIIADGLEDITGAENTSAGNGTTKLAANMLLHLADTAELPGLSEKQESELRRRIRDLASAGFNLADGEAQFEQEFASRYSQTEIQGFMNEIQSGVPKDQRSVGATELNAFLNKYGQVYDLFTALDPDLAKYPSIQEQVKDYTGVISSVYCQSYMTDLLSKEDMQATQIGTNIKLTSVEMEVPPAVTAKYADKTDQTASNVP